MPIAAEEVGTSIVDDELDTSAVVRDVLSCCVEERATPLDVALEVIMLLVWLGCLDDELVEPAPSMDNSTAASTPGLEELL